MQENQGLQVQFGEYMPLDLDYWKHNEEILEICFNIKTQRRGSKPIVNEGVLMEDVIALNCKGSFSGGMMTLYI